MNNSCKNPDKCKRKIHYYKPEFSSVFTHKVIKTKDGEKWISLPKPTIKINNMGELPIDFEHYIVIDKKTNKLLFN